MYDLFVCHASEDKDGFVRPLVEVLRTRGLSVWYDEYSLRPGDSLRENIDHGLATARRAVVVLSPKFFAKSWTRWELNGLVQRHLSSLGNVLIPVWLNVTAPIVEKFSPPLADIVSVSAAAGIDRVADAILKVVRRESRPLPDSAKDALTMLRWILRLERNPGIRLSLTVRRGDEAVFVTDICKKRRSKRSLKLTASVIEDALTSGIPTLENDLARLGPISKSCSQAILAWPIYGRDARTPYAVVGIESMSKWTSSYGDGLIGHMARLTIFWSAMTSVLETPVANEFGNAR